MIRDRSSHASSIAVSLFSRPVRNERTAREVAKASRAKAESLAIEVILSFVPGH